MGLPLLVGIIVYALIIIILTIWFRKYHLDKCLLVESQLQGSSEQNKTNITHTDQLAPTKPDENFQTIFPTGQPSSPKKEK